MASSFLQSAVIGGTLLLYVGAGEAQSRLPHRQVLPSELREVSGMVRTPQGRLWMLNDSHNPPQLFLFDPCARRIEQVRTLPIPNRDWEDLAFAPDGTLYIGDVGNNYQRRRDLCIFRYHPDTERIDSIRFAYPDQVEFPPPKRAAQHFNCEAMVFWRDSLHLFSKAPFGRHCWVKHYVVPAKPGQYVAELRDSLLLRRRVVTGAALSPDGQTLALTSYIIGRHLGVLPYARATVFFFRDYPEGRFLRGHRIAMHLPQFPLARQYEAITSWDNQCWLVANERRLWQRQQLWVIRGPQEGRREKPRKKEFVKAGK